MLQYYTLKIIDIRKETDDAYTYSFKQPGLKKVKYLAGQYLTLIFRINGRRYIRPYSFSSAPLVDSNLEITVKRIPGGIVSNHIIDKLNIDDMVEVMQPLGDFTLEHSLIAADTHIVLWGAGSGITPLISIAKFALHQNTVKQVTLVYGNRNSESIILSNSVAHLETQYNDKFKVYHFHTKPTIDANNPYVIQGRINPAKVLSVIHNAGELQSTVHYICGPVGLKESVKEVLTNLDVNTGRIFSEDFEVVRDPAEFGDVITRQVVINNNGAVAAIEVAKGKSILEAGLDALIELPYSCQTGSCMVCKGRLIKGEIKTIGIKNIPTELKPDERLLCCSFPLTDDVEVEVNIEN